MLAYKVLRLYTTGEKFYVQPLGQDSNLNQILEIDRVTQELILNGAHLVVVTKRKLVGLLFGEEIWEMVEADIIPFPKGTMHLTETQIRENKIFLQMAQNAFQTKGFYFSYTHDITHSTQRLQNTSPDFNQLPLYERADQRFIWNHHLLRMFAVQPEVRKEKVYNH